MASKKTTSRTKQSKSAPKRSSSAGRSSLAAKTKQPTKEEIIERQTVRDEVALIITFLISLLLVLSYFGLCGPFGKVINSFLFGMIGFFTYLFPFALFFLVGFSLSNRGNAVAKRKVIGSIILVFAVTALIELIGGYDSSVGFFEYYVKSSASQSGGGLVGAVLVCLLCGIFGPIAAPIILIVMILLCIIFISGKAIVTYLSHKGEERYHHHKEQRAMYAQEYNQLDLEDEMYDEPRRARTVTLAKPKSKQKKNQDEEEALFGRDDLDEQDSPLSFLDKLKEKGKEQKNAELEEVKVMPMPQSPKEQGELQEFKPDPEQEGFEASSKLIDDVNAIYEEELNRKFGKDNTDSDRTSSNPHETVTYHDTDTFETELDHIGVNDSPSETSLYEQAEPSDQTKAVEPRQTTNQTTKAKSSTNTEPLNGASKGESGEEIGEISQEVVKKYVFPPISLLGKPKPNQKGMSERDLKETAVKLQKTLESFGVRVTITNISCGPAVTRYELSPEQGVKVSKITGLADDIKLNLAAADVRIEAPIPGKAAVGIEVPNKENTAVMLRELLESHEFKTHKSDIAFAVGKDIGGQTVVTDIAKMPHLLIAGATGSGKSVCINTLIMSILYKADPADVRMIMVDPKVVELSVYNGIPHLLIPVVTDPKKASAALNWAVVEMNDRYKKFAELGVRDLKGYNERIKEVDGLNNDTVYKKLPQIIIIVDELADLMMVAPGEVEDSICRLAQMARAAGLHLIIATQRPSVNVITGLIKANVPSRIAFSVSSAIDSRTIIDSSGAEKLLGKGDMLFFPSGYPKPVRVQGAFVSDKEVSAVVDFLKQQNEHAGYSEEVNNMIKNAQSSSAAGTAPSNERDDYFVEAGKFIIEKDKASIGMLQRVYKIGFNRAARIMEQLADAGVVGPEEGTKPRKILMSMEEFEQYVDEYV